MATKTSNAPQPLQNVSASTPSRERTNQQWLDELSGRCPRTVQQQAHEELARHLCRVAFTYLKQHRSQVLLLHGWTGAELALLARGFVQKQLELLARHDFALLTDFNGQGRFLAWSTQLLYRTMAAKLHVWNSLTHLPGPADTKSADGQPIDRAPVALPRAGFRAQPTEPPTPRMAVLLVAALRTPHLPL